MTNSFRVLVGGAALAAGLWFLTAAATRSSAAPPLPKDTFKKAVEADIAALQKAIDTCASDPKEARRHGPTARSLAMMLALYAEATGDAALRTDAIKVAETLGKKDWKAAGDLAKKLAAKPGAAALAPDNLHAKAKYGLDEVMSPFRGGTVGGLNIEKDIRSLRDGKIKVDPAAVEILAARTAALSDYALHMPTDKAESGAKKAQWVKLSQDSIDLSKKLAEEAGKGKSANEKEIVKLVKALDAKCLDCHKEFRDD